MRKISSRVRFARSLFVLFRLVHLFPLRFVNEAVRRVYLKLVPALLSFVFQRDVMVRNSVLSAQDFNFLVSDLDLTILVDPNISESDLRRLKLKYKRAKRIFIFLGEVEINSAAEWSNLEFFKAIPLVQVCHLHRKRMWIQKKLLSATGPYEKAKHLRNLEKIRRKLKELGGLSDKLMDENPKFEDLKKKIAYQGGFLDYWERSYDLSVATHEMYLKVLLTPNRPSTEDDLLLHKSRRLIVSYELLSYLGYQRWESGMFAFENSWIFSLRTHFKNLSQR